MPNERRANLIANVEELKSFILWAKSQKLKSASLGNVSFDFSELAFVNDIESAPDVETTDMAVPPNSPKLPGGDARPSEDDELLYWSARG